MITTKTQTEQQIMDIRAEICSHQASMHNLKIMGAKKSHARKAASLLNILSKVKQEERQYAADCYFGRCAYRTYEEMISELHGN
jgi:hypothetical protein